MTNSKRARENERRKRAAYERKLAMEAAERKKRWRLAGLITASVLGLGAIVGLILALTSVHGEPQASDTLSATPAPTSGGEEPATAEPSPSATATDDSIVLEDGWQASPAPPDPSYADGRDWTAVMSTNQGDITITLDGANAPQATAAFTKLAQSGYYDGTDCHRLQTDGPYLLQCGDVTGTGTGRVGFVYGPLENVPADGVYRAGDVVMVREADDPESMSSQFQIIWKDSTLPTDSAGGYTVVGKVTSGLSIVEGIAQAGTITGDPDGWPALSVIINEVAVS